MLQSLVRATLCLCPVAAALLSSVAPAQAPDANEQKTVVMVRSDVEPVIDGVLEEAVWDQAARVGDLHQVEPFEFAQPSQPTEIRLFYGDDALYIAARMWDSEADRITAQVLRQGESMGSEDRFAIILDPYLDHRSGYRFQVNPNGVRWDALYQDTSRVESNWDGIWRTAASRDDEGWTAEMEIPFKTISFNPNSTEWGINFERTIQRNDETIAWVSRNRQLNPGVAGTATGFFGLEQGRGLDVVPSMTVREERFYAQPGGSGSNLEPSVDVFYKITPSMNGALTFNTDFSATEVDDRQVNLTRFSLFFPEKRDFFLQDADIFEFGRIGGGGGGGGGGRGGGGGGNNNPAVPGPARNNGLPFFSRRIGLSDTGQPIDINVGAKLSGRAGRWNVGALAIQQDAYEAVDESDIFVGRVTANVLDESAVGVIVTDGDPQSNFDASLVGADFRYRNTRISGGRLLEGEVWYQETDTEGVEGENRAYGFGVSSPNAAGWRGGLEGKTIEEHFDPAVGFVNNSGIRDYALNFGYRHRMRGDTWLRSVYGGFDGYESRRLDTGEVESSNRGLRLTLNNNTSDNLFSRIVRQREVLTEPFTIYDQSDGLNTVVIPVGDYTFDYVFVGMQTGNQRKFASRFRYSTGDYYEGDRVMTNTDFTWRPSEKLSLDIGYSYEEISLPQGDFEVRVSRFTTQYVFSSTLSWVNLIQYDNVSENLGLNSRLHWIPEAGREGFIVLNHSLSDTDRNDSFHSTNADLSIKFSYTWRF
jgi:hypothetical protein